MREWKTLLSIQNVCATALLAGLVVGVVVSATGCKDDSTDEGATKSTSGPAQGDDTRDGGREGGGATDGTSDSGVHGGESWPPSCGPCEAPASECIDESTRRSFGAACNDAGQCEITPYDTECPARADGPACVDGQCNVVIIR